MLTICFDLSTSMSCPYCPYCLLNPKNLREIMLPFGHEHFVIIQFGVRTSRRTWRCRAFLPHSGSNAGLGQFQWECP